MELYAHGTLCAQDTVNYLFIIFKFQNMLVQNLYLVAKFSVGSYEGLGAAMSPILLQSVLCLGISQNPKPVMILSCFFFCVNYVIGCLHPQWKATYSKLKKYAVEVGLQTDNCYSPCW